MEIQFISKKPIGRDTFYLLDSESFVLPQDLTDLEKDFILREKNNKQSHIFINRYTQRLYFAFIETNGEHVSLKEKARIAGSRSFKALNKDKIEHITIIDMLNSSTFGLAFLEGMMLSSYQFIKYFRNKDEETNAFKTAEIFSTEITENHLKELVHLVEAVFSARNMINEPVNVLNAQSLAEAFQEMGSKAGFKVEVFDLAKIKALKMGGLLAVNRGSMDPPTFSILEWNPRNAKNEKPIVLVGKGVVYDSGGLSLKPTLNSMDYMKSDMSGAAAVGSLLYLCAINELPLHVIGLVPATDNRPGENAFTPGDVIEMHNGLFVEVLNTDAEGRLILGDALSYASKYNPELVIDLATLTGAASVAVGELASVVMGNTPENIEKLKQSGFETYERLVELPMWEEYGDLIKSDIADIKNSGKRDAGTITAGKFLEHFTSYPWIHLDIASGAFLHKASHYRTLGGTGIGIRLIWDFLKNRT